MELHTLGHPLDLKSHHSCMAKNERKSSTVTQVYCIKVTSKYNPRYEQVQLSHQLQPTSRLWDSPACRLWQFLCSQAGQVQGMPQLVSSHGFFSQGILVALVTGTGRNLHELESKLLIKHSDQYLSDLYSKQFLNLNCETVVELSLGILKLLLFTYNIKISLLSFLLTQ